MACSLLFTGKSLGSRSKGYISKAIHNHPWTPGGLEGPPDWGAFEIIDAVADDMRLYTDSWYLRYEVTEIPTPPKIRLRFVVHPSVISASGQGRDSITVRMINWAFDKYGGDPVNSSVNHMLIDFPDPLIYLPSGEVSTVPELISTFHDDEAELFDASSHYIADADVDTIMTPPFNGIISMDLATFQSAWVKARLDD